MEFIKTPECQTFRFSIPERKITMPEPVMCRDEAMQTGFFGPETG
jgi:hypothetical protein